MALISSAEAIGAVVSDLRNHRVKPGLNTKMAAIPKLLGPKWAIAGAPVVDATSIYRSLVADGKEFDVYGNNVAPPWKQAALGFQTKYGAVVVVDLYVTDGKLQWQPGDEEDSAHADHTIDWNRVECVLNASLWLGGRNRAGQPVATSGPFHWWRIALYPGGEIADIRWHQIETLDEDATNGAIATLLATFNFLNCRNVQLVEPHRPRAMQRRIARHGFRVSELSVTPIGRSTRSEPSGNHIALPLHSVRGHFAEYGKNGKGLLFGKLAGRYWIPQHARGQAEVGVVAQKFTVET